MSFIYQALAILPNENRPSLARIEERLKKVFSTEASIVKIKVKLDRIIVAIDDWQMNIRPNCSPEKISESQKIAELYLKEDNSQKPDLSTYGYRIEVNCHPDPQMNRFKYYVCALGVLADFPGAIVFNPITQGFIE